MLFQLLNSHYKIQLFKKLESTINLQAYIKALYYELTVLKPNRVGKLAPIGTVIPFCVAF